MGALAQFKLGRPGYEYLFEINPAAVSIEETPLAVYNRNLAGDLKKGVLKSSSPTVRISSEYLTQAQRDKFASLVGISDTFLSFQMRDDLQVVLERNVPLSTVSVVVQNNSATRLSAALVAAGFASQITVAGVFTTPNGAGTNYYAAGSSYADASRTITLSSALPDTSPVYVTYTYKGWLVDIKSIPFRVAVGSLDNYAYDFELTGA